VWIYVSPTDVSSCAKYTLNVLTIGERNDLILLILLNQYVNRLLCHSAAAAADRCRSADDISAIRNGWPSYGRRMDRPSQLGVAHHRFAGRLVSVLRRQLYRGPVPRSRRRPRLRGRGCLHRRLGVHGHRCGHHAAHAAGGGTRLAIVALVRVDATHHSSAVRRRVASVYPLLLLTTLEAAFFSRLCVSFREQEFVKSTSLEVQNVRDIEWVYVRQPVSSNRNAIIM